MLSSSMSGGFPPMGDSCMAQMRQVERTQATFSNQHSKLVERLNTLSYNKCGNAAKSVTENCDAVSKALGQAISNPAESQQVATRQRQNQMQMEFSMMQQMRQNVGTPYRIPANSSAMQFQNNQFRGATPSVLNPQMAASSFSLGGYSSGSPVWK
jgi:hypothetical protein